MTTATRVCDPAFKVRYVFGQMLSQTELSFIKEGVGIDPDTPTSDIIDSTDEVNERTTRPRFNNTSVTVNVEGNDHLQGLNKAVTEGPRGSLSTCSSD